MRLTGEFVSSQVQQRKASLHSEKKLIIRQLFVCLFFSFFLFFFANKCVKCKSDYYQHPGLVVTESEKLFQHFDKQAGMNQIIKVKSELDSAQVSFL